MHLYGREIDTAAVRSRHNGVVVVAGDSGIGKTRFLASLAEGWNEDDLVAAPSTLRSVRGSLQGALAEAIGDCLHQYTILDPDAAQAIWTTIKATAVQLADATGRQAGRLLVSRAFEFLESKIGKDAAGVVKGVLGEVLRPASASYEERLEALVAPDTAADLSHIASEIAQHTGRRLVLLLDGGERLAVDDRSLLAELTTSLDGAPVLVVVCVNSSTVEGLEIVRVTEARDAYCHQIGSLNRRSVYEWLAAEDIPQSSWDAIVHASSGYPLFIDDAIRLVRAGVSLSEIQPPVRFESLLRGSWQALEPGLQLIVTKLSGFTDPPSEEFLGTYLGLEQLEMSILRKRLVATGVFVARADGDEWFHERRRQYVWGSLLTASDRANVSATMLASLRSWITSSNRIDGWIPRTIPSIVRQVPLADLGEDLGSLLSLTRNELGILWALLEVAEPSGKRGEFSETSEVVRYAAVRAGFRGDPVAAIERLVDLKLVYTAANEHLSIMCAIIPNAFAHAALIGEIERTFEVRPIPRFASSAFEAFVRPPLEPFKSAAISLGPGSLANHRNAMDEFDVAAEASPSLSQVSGLGIDIAADGHPVTITAIFESPEHRDAARARIADRLGSTRAGHVTLRGFAELPPNRSRYGRYRALLGLLELDRSFVPVPDIAALVHMYQQTADCFSIFRRYIDAEDASALGLLDPLRYIVDTSGWPESSIELLVSGNISRDSELVNWRGESASLFDPLLELRLRALGALEPEESIVQTTGSGGVARKFAHPLRRAVERIEQRGRAFNKGLPPVKVSVDEVELQNRITQERGVVSSIVSELAAAEIIADQSDSSDSLIIVLAGADADAGPWSRTMASCYAISDGRCEVSVRVLEAGAPSPEWDDPHGYLRSLGFIRDVGLISRVSDGVSTAIIGPLLGYAPEDLQFARR
ncbi:ATP-binding protein [Cellulomonas xylanilytica]|nr:ATP-binding protein [Cellulomonas xylanilytica]